MSVFQSAKAAYAAIVARRSSAPEPYEVNEISPPPEVAERAVPATPAVPGDELNEINERSPRPQQRLPRLPSLNSLISYRECDYQLITDPAKLNEVAALVRASKVVGLDLETTSLNLQVGRVRLLSLYIETAGGRLTYLIDLFAIDPTALSVVMVALAETEVVGHNLAFDLVFLAPLGFAPGRVWDTMLASQILHAGERGPNNAPLKHGLKDVAARHLGEEVDKSEQTGDWSGRLTPSQLAYAAADAELPVRLMGVMLPKLTAAGLTPTTVLEMAALPCVVWAAAAGVAVDGPAWLTLAEEAEAEVGRFKAALDAADPAPGSGRNWNSNPQVRAAFAAAGIALTTTGDDALAAVDHPLAELLRAYRGAAKRAGTYGRAWLEHVAPDGRVYPGWRQVGAGASGRMSCAAPNLQQLPRDGRYRRCFAAPPGRVLVKADYSQVELRLAAKIAAEHRMLEAYRRGEDLHAATARAVLGVGEVTAADRQLAKAVNFGLVYGMGAEGFRDYARSNYSVALTAAEAAAYREKFFANYPGLRAWHRRQREGRVDTRTALGRRRLGVVRFTEKLNTPVQGTGADGLKAAMALLWERRAQCPSAVPVLFVHDEIVVECDRADADAAKAWLVAAMEDGMRPFADPVPVVVDARVQDTWGG